ncbi:hypothetical protein [Nonlabens xiamenensis]|uniref:hypothetical protein n=1 Tax=Nonlabens xiamenensis TaxID=2341043 RepID=UPI000F60871F|nr:hypothetical protein [Nonlabens xiamenensis]
MVRYISFLIFLTIPFCLFAQVGINTDNPLDGTSLHIEGNDAGILINRVSLTGKDDTTTVPGLAAAQEGLMVYNTVTTNRTDKTQNVFPGFYYWTGTLWESVERGGIKRTGWVSLSDGDLNLNLTGISAAAAANPLNFTHLLLDFNNDPSDGSISSYAPTGYNAFDFFDDTSHTIQALELGDSAQLRFQCNAVPAENNSYLILAIDIGTAASPIIIYQKTIPLLRGSGQNNRISESILLFQLGTFLANGAKIRIAYNQGNGNAGGSVSLSNFGLVLQRF